MPEFLLRQLCLSFVYEMLLSVRKDDPMNAEVYHIAAPIWAANPFGDDEELAQSDREYAAYFRFYMDLLPYVAALSWAAGPLLYVFSKDTQSGGYRLSCFDKIGALRHTARQTIADLFEAETFPFDGRDLTVVA